MTLNDHTFSGGDVLTHTLVYVDMLVALEPDKIFRKSAPLP